MILSTVCRTVKSKHISCKAIPTQRISTGVSQSSQVLVAERTVFAILNSAQLLSSETKQPVENLTKTPKLGGLHLKLQGYSRNRSVPSITKPRPSVIAAAMHYLKTHYFQIPNKVFILKSAMSRPMSYIKKLPRNYRNK